MKCVLILYQAGLWQGFEVGSFILWLRPEQAGWIKSCTWEGKTELSCPLRITHCVTHETFFLRPRQVHQRPWFKVLYLPSLFGQDDWILTSLFFCMSKDLGFIMVHKHGKKEVGQCPTIFTSHLVNNPYIFVWSGTIFIVWTAVWLCCQVLKNQAN